MIEWDFKLNEYDKCAANKTMKGKQCTIIWHVNELKISHVDIDMVGDIIENARFGQESPLVTSWGKILE